MVRNYEKKTNRQPYTPRKCRKALELVRKGYSLRVAAKEANINYGKLFRLHQKTKDSDKIDDVPDKTLTPDQNSRSVFSKEEEDDIASYCVDIALSGYGLSTIKVRELAYETATINNLTVPPSWHYRKLAGVDWLHGKFMLSCS